MLIGFGGLVKDGLHVRQQSIAAAEQCPGSDLLHQLTLSPYSQPNEYHGLSISVSIIPLLLVSLY